MARIKQLAAVIACAVVSQVADADTLHAYEGFNYALGSALSGQTGGQGWAAAWGGTTPNTASVVAGLGYTDSTGQQLATQEGAVRTNSAVTFGQETRGTTYAFGQAGDSVWVSFLVQQSPNPTLGVNYAGVALGQGWTFGSDAMVGNITGTTAGVGAFYTTTDFQNSTAVIPANSVSFLVLRYDFAASGNDAISLWVNPVLGAALGAPDASGSFRNFASSFSGITLAYGDNRPFVFDELRIGSSYAAVATPVPEPGSLALLLAGVAAVGVAARRSRSG